MNDISVDTTAVPSPGERPGFWFKRIALIAWMALIFALSADPQSGAKTGGILVFLLALAHIHLSGPYWTLAHHLLRKLAHISVYAVLGLLFSWNFPGRPVLSWFLATLYAGSDEFHQVFVPNRGASVWDVALDSASAGLALALAEITMALASRRRSS